MQVGGPSRQREEPRINGFVESHGASSPFK